MHDLRRRAHPGMRTRVRTLLTRTAMILGVIGIHQGHSPAGTVPANPPAGSSNKGGAPNEGAGKKLMAFLQRIADERGTAPRTPGAWNQRLEAVRKAGDSGCRDFIPVLKQIAETAGKSRFVCANALHALWELGEPKGYFLGLARDPKADETLAYYAIQAAARDPDEQTLRALEEIRQHTRSQRVRDAASHAKWVASWIAAPYAKLKTPKDRARYLLDLIGDHIAFLDGYDPTGPWSGLAPEIAWGCRKLRELSGEAPETVAGEVYDAQVGALLPVPSDSLPRWRSNLARCLDKGTLAELARLRREDHAMRALPPPRDEADRERFKRMLGQAQAGELPLWQARVYVRRAGQTANKEYAPILRMVAEGACNTRNRILCFDALHALADLGEPTEYFLALARRFKEKDGEERARYAVLILARTPEQQTLACLREIGDEAQRMDPVKCAGICHAVEEAIWVEQTAREYAQAQTLAARAEIAICALELVWSPDDVDEYEARTQSVPLAVWGRRALRTLSESFPHEVALVLSSRDMSEGRRSSVAGFLCEPAAAEFQRLERERKAPKPK